MGKNPKVTVITAAYNANQYLKDALDSLLNQTYQNFEVVIIDDGSTDNTKEIVYEYVNKHPNLFRYYYQSNRGCVSARNSAIKKARGEYIAVLDADDIYLSSKLTKQVNFLDTHPEVALISSDIEFIDADGRSLGKSNRSGDAFSVAWHLLFHNFLGGHSQVLFRRDLIVKLGCYSKIYRYSSDYALWSLLTENHNIVILPDVLTRYRMHSDKISVKFRGEQSKFSHSITTGNIKKLLGSEIQPAIVAEIRSFWLSQFVFCKNVHDLNSLLHQIYLAFLKRRTNLETASFRKSRQLKALISKQFFYWYKFSKNLKFRNKLHILFYAFLWHKGGTMNSVLKMRSQNLADMLFNKLRSNVYIFFWLKKIKSNITIMMDRNRKVKSANGPGI